MAYTFKMVIGGVIGLVNRTSTGSVLVVVPDTLLDEPKVGTRPGKKPRVAVDGDDLLRHDPLLKLSPRHVIHLRGQKLEFELPAGELAVHLGDMLKIKDALPANFGAADCRLANDYLNGTLAAALLEITTGTVESTSPPKAKRLGTHRAYLDRIGETPTSSDTPADVVVEWTVEVKNDGPLELRETDLTGGKVDRHLLEPQNGKIELELMNHRAHAGKPPDPNATEDSDFRWFYDIVASRDKVRARLNGGKKEKAPVPRAGKGLLSSIDGQLCRPCEFCD